MKNQTIALEISHKFIKVVIGKMVGDDLSIVYTKKVPIHHFLENGIIKDRISLINELVKLNPLLDEEYHINQMLDDVVLVLPPYGLEIYQTQQLTSVISPEKIIGKLDVKNIYSIIRNKKLPNDNELINIFLDTFEIDTHERFSFAPIGKTSGAISAEARVHTLPKRINDEYTNVMIKSGIKVGQKVVSSFGAVELLKTDQSIPKNYYLIDIGSNSTSVSLIGNSELLATRSFSWGSDLITEKLIQKFNISETLADSIKTLFGLDSRQTAFKYPLIQATESTPAYYREDINETIEDELQTFLGLLNSSIEQLNTQYKVNGMELPILLIGGGSKLHGLVDYLKTKLGKEEITLVTPKVIGGRDPSMFAVLGAVIVFNKYLSELDSNLAVNVLREE